MSSDRMMELETSLELYEQQLSQVHQALDADSQNADLTQLVGDLSQLITLTSQNLLEEKKAKLLAQLDQAHPKEPEEKENAEKEQEQETEQKKEEDEEDEAIDLKQFEGKLFEEKNNLKRKDSSFSFFLVPGMKCQAPHTSRSSGGSVSMSNAMISHCENSAEDSLEHGTDSILVRVLFTHPVTQDMLPCSFYMAGKCKFPDDKCRFSHGEVVKLSDLKEFKVCKIVL